MIVIPSTAKVNVNTPYSQRRQNGKINKNMKSKLLIKLRNIGREMINITSITKENGVITGMSYGYDYNEYKGLFELGDTEEDVKEKAARMYIKTNINEICKKYLNNKK